jgi:hypothetical protein
MQTAKRKAPIGLEAGIGARTTNNILERTEMDTSTSRKAPATKAKLRPVMTETSTLTRAESRMLSAARRLDQHNFEFITKLMELHAHDHPAAAIVKSKPAFRLVQGGAA